MGEKRTREEKSTSQAKGILWKELGMERTIQNRGQWGLLFISFPLGLNAGIQYLSSCNAISRFLPIPPHKNPWNGLVDTKFSTQN